MSKNFLDIRSNNYGRQITVDLIKTIIGDPWYFIRNTKPSPLEDVDLEDDNMWTKMWTQMIM